MRQPPPPMQPSFEASWWLVPSRNANYEFRIDYEFTGYNLEGENEYVTQPPSATDTVRLSNCFMKYTLSRSQRSYSNSFDLARGCSSGRQRRPFVNLQEATTLDDAGVVPVAYINICA